MNEVRVTVADALGPAKSQLAVANRILVAQRVLDAFGHVSMRHPHQPGQFLISANKAPATVTAADVQVLTLDGACVAGEGPRLYLERFIHAAIYQARPDVCAVVHSHAPAVVPFTVSRAPLRPVCHMGGFLRLQAPLFEIRDHAGTGSDMLIRNLDLGHHLAASLGDAEVVLMRGHGITVCGSSLPQAVFRSVYAQKNAEIQLAATALGEITFLTPEEAAASDEANNGQIARAWACWEAECS